MSSIASNKVTIGNSSNNAKLYIYESTGSTLSSTTGSLIIRRDNTGGTSSIVLKNSSSTNYGHISYRDDSNNHPTTNNSRLEIGCVNGILHLQKNDGYIGIGTNNALVGNVSVAGFTSAIGYRANSSSNVWNVSWDNVSGSVDGAYVYIDKTRVGIFANSSDYRIKKNIKTQTTPALKRIMQIRPVTYEYADCPSLLFKSDGIVREGFIAHEVAEIIPSAVIGEKDAPNQIQNLKLDALCSVIVKAMQEQESKMQTLQTQIDDILSRLNNAGV